MINIEFVMLPIESGPTLTVGQLTWEAGLPEGKGSRRKLCMLSYRSYYIYWTLKEHLGWEKILKSLYGAQATKLS